MYFLLMMCTAVRLFAGENAAGDSDPFGAYRDGVEKQILAMLRGGVPQTLPVTLVVSRVEQVATQVGPKETDINFFAKRYWGGHESEAAAAFYRLQQLRPTIEPILDQEGVPKGLLAVVLVESGAQPFAASPQQARGLWQFIPETARRYGLTVSADRDERVQVEAATRAAARYLRDLYSHFGDWPLALAAYNAGETAVQRVLNRTDARTFWQASSAGLLPSETQRYVPAVLAAMHLLAQVEPAGVNPVTKQRGDWVYALAQAGN
jgi:hypothetical protein